MEKKILSPIQVWQDYNPIVTPLDISIVRTYVRDGIFYKELFFTAENYEDGKIRVFTTIAYKVVDEGGKRPLLLCIPDVSNTFNDNFIEDIVGDNYIFASFNYSGKGEEGRVTQYPESRYYGSYDRAGEHKATTCPNATESSWYLWTMIARRVITVLTMEEKALVDKVGVLGVMTGAEIGWQVAGTDGRVSAFVPVIGCGYLEVAGVNKYASTTKVGKIDVDATSWLAGIASQAYARFICCPVLYVGTTNSRISDMDRVVDIMNLLRSEDKTVTICPRMINQLTVAGYATIKKWLSSKLISNKPVWKGSEIALKCSENRMYLNISVSELEEFSHIEVYFAEKELNHALRNWQKLDTVEEIGEGEYLATLFPTREEERAFVFVNTFFKDGTAISSKLLTFVPKEYNLEAYPNPYQRRILYDASMGKGSFSVENNRLYLEPQVFMLKEGGQKIKGICCSEGELYTFNVGAGKFLNNDDGILQLDIYTEENKVVEVVLSEYDGVYLTDYRVSIWLTASTNWQKLRLEHGEFKNREMLPLKNWKNIKKISFVNATNVIFNNILWV